MLIIISIAAPDVHNARCNTTDYHGNTTIHACVPHAVSTRRSFPFLIISNNCKLKRTCSPNKGLLSAYVRYPLWQDPLAQVDHISSLLNAFSQIHASNIITVLPASPSVTITGRQPHGLLPSSQVLARLYADRARRLNLQRMKMCPGRSSCDIHMVKQT